MCGRFTLRGGFDDLAEAFPFLALPPELPPRFNIAPTQPVAACLNDGANRLEFLRWGLIPSWAKEISIGNKTINARCETLAEKPSFEQPYRSRRCLVLADGYYEWRLGPDGKTKIPTYIHLKTGKPFAFAGLWDSWRPEPGVEPIRSCTIITTVPNAVLARIHDRMPVILSPDSYQPWLDREEKEPGALDAFLRPYPGPEFATYPVSTLVNNPKNDDPRCVKRFEERNLFGEL